MTAMTFPWLGATKQILYVEENPDCRKVRTYLLGYYGYGVTSRYSDGNGVELCRQIRAVDPHPPILFYSSAAYRADIEAGIAAGAQQYLTKPTGSDFIEHTISHLLAGTTGAQAQIQ
jgi:DNA-binding NarL/FixJ family response regulator